MTMFARDDHSAAIAALYPARTQKKAIGAGASAAIDDPVAATTTAVIVQADVDCFIAVGENPNATLNDMPLWAKMTIVVPVRKGKDKIAAITPTGSGTLYVTEGGNF